MSSILLLSKRSSESGKGRTREIKLVSRDGVIDQIASSFYYVISNPSLTFISKVLLLFFAVISLALGLYTDFGADPEQVPCADPPPGQEGCNAAKVSPKRKRL